MSKGDELLAGPIRGDLLGADHLAARAREVARGQRLTAHRRPLRPARLLARLGETGRILAAAYERLSSIPADERDASSADDWLLDNYHVVQEQLQEVQANLPGGYYRELPELAGGPLAGYPRVYEIALSLISHTEARLDVENVDLYVSSFQGVAPLSIGELWAIPAMLRIGLIESVRRLTLRSMQRLDDRALAARWATRILAAAEIGGPALRAVMRELAAANLPHRAFFVARLLQLLRQVEGTSPTLSWLDHWLHESGQGPDNASATSTRHLALTQLMMANSITSLRSIGQRDWRAFVEHQSVMESVLREDPAGFHAQMTFATRDAYRHEVERIAKATGHRERSVAQWAVDLARRHAGPGGDASAPEGHVGYYLVDDGLPELEAMAGYRPTVRERIVRTLTTNPDLVLTGLVTLCMAGAVSAVFALAPPLTGPALWLLLAVTFLPALDIAINAFNHLVTLVVPPRQLPRLDLHADGIPPAYRTVVVVPTLFADVDDVRDALEHLEVQFLANREPNLHFAVLSDFTDAPPATCPGDGAIEVAAMEGVRALNARHADEGSPVFSLLHRPRRWNATQGVWMGWERKRGKLAEFNRLAARARP